MPSTYTLISSNVLSTSAATVTFSSIPSTYTDLMLKASVKTTSTSATGDFWIRLNSSTSSYSYNRLWSAGGGGFGAEVSNGDYSGFYTANANGSSALVANIFANGEYYIPNYAGSNRKLASQFMVQERNNSLAYIETYAHLSDITAAITSLTIIPNGTDLASGSSFYLYGIKNS